MSTAPMELTMIVKEVKMMTQSNFVAYQFDLREDMVRPTFERWRTLNLKIYNHTLLSSQAAHATHRPTNSYRKASPLGSAPQEIYPVAPEKSLEDSRITRKG